MSDWINQFRDHAIWEVLRTLGPALDQALSLDGLDASTVEGLTRLRAILTFTGKRLAGADAYLFQPGPLDNIAANLKAATVEVQSFVTDGNAARVTQANGAADVVLTHLVQLNVPFTTEDFVGAKEAADSYRRGLDSILKSVQSLAANTSGDLEALRTRLAELATEISTERQHLTTLAAENQSQFSTAQETRSREWSEDQKTRQEQLAALVAESSKWLVDKEAEYIELKTSIEKQHAASLDELKKDFINSATLMRDEMSKRKKEVEKLVGIIGNLGVTSGYQKAANEARTKTLVWQIVAVLSMLGLITFAAFAFLPSLAGPFTWSGFAGRIFISLTVAVLAAYAVSQADKYQKIERGNRKLALELEAIGPFIASLPKERQEEFILKIGDRSFGHNDTELNINDKSPATFLDVLKSKEAREFLTELKGILKSEKS